MILYPEQRKEVMGAAKAAPMTQALKEDLDPT